MQLLYLCISPKTHSDVNSYFFIASPSFLVRNTRNNLPPFSTLYKMYKKWNFVRKKASFLRLFFLNIMVLRKSDNSIVNLIKKSLFYHFSVSTSTMYLSSSHSKSHSPSYVSSGSVRVSSYPSWNNTPSVYGDSSSEITNLISASIPFCFNPQPVLTETRCRCFPGGAYLLAVGDTDISAHYCRYVNSTGHLLPTFHLEVRRIPCFSYKTALLPKTDISYIYHF